MALSEQRAKELSDYLTNDIERAKSLLELTPTEAMEQIRKDGLNFTEEEITEYGEQLAAVMQNLTAEGELNEKTLESVAGGFVVAGVIVTAGVTLFVAGVTFGYKVARDRGW